MMNAPLIGHGQDTPDTFNRGSLGFNSDRVPSNYHSRDFIRRPNLNQSDSVSSNGGRPPLNPVSEFTSLSRPDPKYADYSLKQKRVESYRNWPPSAKQKPENLIDAGLFYTGQADSVRCFLCGTGLRNWDPEDEPWVEHARWAPECFYVRDKKGQEFINLVQVAVRQQQMQEALQQQTDAMAREATDIAADCVPPNVDTELQRNAASSQPTTSGQKQPTNAERKNPLLSDAAVSVLAMGYLPRIVKMAVDKVLQSKGWNGMSGSNIANEIFDMEESGEIDKNSCMVPNVEFDGPWKKLNEKVPEDMKDLVQKHSEMKERTMCILCCEERVSIVFLPCGHLSSCAQCSPALKNCPVCRESITGTIKALQQQTDAMASEATDIAADRVSANADTEPMDCDTNSALDGSTHEISQTPPFEQYKHLQLNSQARLNTFKNYPNNAIKKKVLAENGFCYIGDGKDDTVQCVFCGEIWKGWTEENDITSVHRYHSRKCVHVDQLDNENFHANMLNQEESLLRIAKTIYETGSDSSSSQMLHKYNEERVPLNSNAAQRVLELGYSEDVVKLAMDNLELKGLELSADNICSETVDMEECDQNDKNGNCSFPAKFEFDNARNKREPTDLMEENRQLREATLCKICLDKKVEIIFLPCGHLCCCEMCAPAFQNCPMCRAEIKSTNRTYMS